MLNLYAAWIGIVLGFISGSGIGLMFHREDWLGGYSSWRRRMLRLGHISFFGLAFINLSYAVSSEALDFRTESPYPSLLFIAGAIAMPLICLLSAIKKPFRHLFFIPVLCLLVGSVWYLATAVPPMAEAVTP